MKDENTDYEVTLQKSKRIKNIIISSDADQLVRVSVVLDMSNTLKVEVRRKQGV